MVDLTFTTSDHVDRSYSIFILFFGIPLLMMKYIPRGNSAKCGFHQGIPDHTLGTLRWFTPKNHTSAVLASKKIENTLAKKERKSYFWTVQP